MPESEELARRLVEYDEQLASDLLETICIRLGGPGASGIRQVGKVREFLSDPSAARLRSLSRLGDVDAATSTAEWKSEFGRSERLRTLGLALVQRLAPGSAAR